MDKILGQTDVECTLMHQEKSGHALPRVAPDSVCTVCIALKNCTAPPLFGFSDITPSTIVLAPIRPSFEPNGLPFHPSKDCKRKLNLPSGFEGI